MTLEILENLTRGQSSEVDDLQKPTFVFDAGMGNWSLFFHPLAQKLRRFAKVCLINRDGYLDSKQSSASTDAFSIVHQLRRVLDENEIHEPVILVGHSLGGLHVRMFQHLFPDKVRGLILLDSAHPHMLDVLPQVRSNLTKQIRLVNILRVMANMGLLRFAKNSMPTFGLPPALHVQYYKVTTQAKYYIAYHNEMKSFESMLTTCKHLRDLGNLPLLIISSPYGLNNRITVDSEPEKSEDKAWLSLQEDLIGLSSQTTFVKSKGDHFLHLTDTAFVAETISNFYRQF